MRLSAVVCSLALSLPGLLSAQTIEVGTGSPTDAVRGEFQAAFGRGTFSQIAALPPSGAVAKFGTTGLSQVFNDSSRAGSKLALVKSTSTYTPENSSTAVFQVLTDIYAYYSSVGVATAGYPTGDTQYCPNVACTFQLFDRNYALFAWTAGANDTLTVTVRDPYYTRWQFFGGINGMGPGMTAETTTTSSFGSNATYQAFSNGVLFNITSGALNGKLVSVRQPVYSLYQSKGGVTGPLGLPVGDAQTLANGKKRQTFEGGSIDFDDSGNPPVLRAPVASVVLQPGTTPVRLNAGDSYSLTAIALGADGSMLTDRVINFVTSNSLVVALQANGSTATIRAAGGGTARISATSEGKTSLPIDFIVSSVCCAVGEGAPTAAITQAMNDAVSRNRIQLHLPGPERVSRAGTGYIQHFQGTDANSTPYLITIADSSALAYIVGGQTLTRYEQLGGSAGAIGFPTGDAAASGRQSFERGMLAGSPVRMVTGGILARWAQTGYEAGEPGAPTSEASQATSFTATAGQMQTFAGGLIVAAPKGGYFLRPVAADQYLASGGIIGTLGLPLGEESISGTIHTQEFEGGTLTYNDGSAGATIAPRPRTPAVTISPSGPLPGSRVRIAVTGFQDGATLRVSVSGQTDFLIPTQSGSYVWDSLVAANAAAGPVAIRAVDTATNASAQGSYTVRTLAQAQLQLTAVLGDSQTGSPGVRLPVPLRVVLRDNTGIPVSGMAVRFTASPGASVSPDAGTTDTSGQAETSLQLPASEGIALVTAEAGGRVVTFTARATGGSVVSFPKLMQTSTDKLGFGPTTIADGGALLASAASIIRYMQLRGDLRNPNGMADVPTLNDFLRRACVSDSQGSQMCDGFLTAPGSNEPIVNLWRLAGFVGGNLDVSAEQSDVDSIRTLVAGSAPVLVSLALKANDALAGSHFVVATGISSDGSIQIQDPRPQFARASLSDYTGGFTDSSGTRWSGVIIGAARLIARTPSSTSFLVTSDAAIRLLAPTGECGVSFQVLNMSAPSSGASSPSPSSFFTRSCDGAGGEYQLESAADAPIHASITDMSPGGGRTDINGSKSAAFRISRANGALLIAPQQATLTSGTVVNTATFTPDIASGGLASIFGSGLGRAGSATAVDIAGRSATVLFSSAFQVNLQIPAGLAAGSYAMRISSPYGTVEQSVDVQRYAPEIFSTFSGTGFSVRRGAVATLWATGLGDTVRTGNLDVVTSPVTVVIGGQSLRPDFAGLAPGLAGIYQINIVIPATFPPGLDQTLRLRQADVDSMAAQISIQ